jgi:predicted lipoprotein with Yx(FWY)xxD motif
MRRTTVRLATVACAVAVIVAFAPAGADASSGSAFGHHHWRGDGHGHHHGSGSVVSVESSPYGEVLVVGGNGAGYDPTSPAADPAGYLYPPGSSLYSPSIDPPAFGRSPYVAGCDATTQATSPIEGGPDTCAGSETDPTADWPALTTDAPPVAGPGVDRWLLGAVYRADLGTYQVTYAGHPLYLFDQGPNSFTGEDFFESAGPILFPWQTAWFLMSADGQFNPGAANLSVLTPQSGTDYSSNVLATEMLPNIGLPGGVPVAVYTFSADVRGHSRCYGACAREFIPVTTVGTPTELAGVNPTAIGVTRRFDGTLQVTYNGHPLYIYNQEQPLPLGPSDIQTVGNGNGVTGFGGTLSLVSP